MITIEKPYIEVDNDKAYLKAHVTISEDTSLKFKELAMTQPYCSWLVDVDYPPQFWKEESSLWFSVDARYEEYLSCERSNAFVLAMFWYAIATGSDICFEAPLSRKLYNGIKEKLIPALAENGIPPVSLSGPVTSEPVSVFKGFATGMSCGVDSFYTLHSYQSSLTHLTFYSGSYILPYQEKPYDINEVFRDRERTYSEYSKRAETIAAHHGLPLVVVRTNLDKDFYRGGYIFSAMYRHIACSLALEKLFSVYISSSSGHQSHSMEISLFSPTQLYEDLLCDCLRTESFQYITSDHELRKEKIKAIAEDADFQRFAEVCFNQRAGHKNCGHCSGCWKTMIPLDMLGKLEKFHESFDLEEYYKNRREIFSDLIRFSFRPKSDSARDMVKQLLELANEKPSEAGRIFTEVYRSELLD